MLQSVFAGSELRSADELLLKERAIKTAPEVAALRRTAAAADAGLAAFRAGIRPGARDIDLAADVERIIEAEGVRLGGATRVRAWAYVMSGPQTAQAYLSYEMSTPRTMREGTASSRELGVVADGYWNDLSRIRRRGSRTRNRRDYAAGERTAH
jgi:Xaa-Pro aminopeptidase